MYTPPSSRRTESEQQADPDDQLSSTSDVLSAHRDFSDSVSFPLFRHFPEKSDTTRLTSQLVSLPTSASYPVLATRGGSYIQWSKNNDLGRELSDPSTAYDGRSATSVAGSNQTIRKSPDNPDTLLRQPVTRRTDSDSTIPFDMYICIDLFNYDIS